MTSPRVTILSSLAQWVVGCGTGWWLADMRLPALGGFEFGLGNDLTDPLPLPLGDIILI